MSKTHYYPHHADNFDPEHLQDCYQHTQQQLELLWQNLHDPQSADYQQPQRWIEQQQALDMQAYAWLLGHGREQRWYLDFYVDQLTARYQWALGTPDANGLVHFNVRDVEFALPPYPFADNQLGFYKWLIHFSLFVIQRDAIGLRRLNQLPVQHIMQIDPLEAALRDFMLGVFDPGADMATLLGHAMREFGCSIDPDRIGFEDAHLLPLLTIYVRIFDSDEERYQQAVRDALAACYQNCRNDHTFNLINYPLCAAVAFAYRQHGWRTVQSRYLPDWICYDDHVAVQLDSVKPACQPPVVNPQPTQRLAATSVETLGSLPVNPANQRYPLTGLRQLCTELRAALLPQHQIPADSAPLPYSGAQVHKDMIVRRIRWREESHWDNLAILFDPTSDYHFSPFVRFDAENHLILLQGYWLLEKGESHRWFFDVATELVAARYQWAFNPAKPPLPLPGSDPALQHTRRDRVEFYVRESRFCTFRRPFAQDELKFCDWLCHFNLFYLQQHPCLSKLQLVQPEQFKWLEPIEQAMWHFLLGMLNASAELPQLASAVLSQAMATKGHTRQLTQCCYLPLVQIYLQIALSDQEAYQQAVRQALQAHYDYEQFSGNPCYIALSLCAAVAMADRQHGWRACSSGYLPQWLCYQPHHQARLTSKQPDWSVMTIETSFPD